MATATRWIRQARQFTRLRHKELRVMLDQEQQHLAARKQALRHAPEEVAAVRDDIDQSAEVVETGVALAGLELSSRLVQGIERALRRLRSGHYGTCSDCESKISAVRLKALPFASLCHGCQETRDAADAATFMSERVTQGWQPLTA